MPAQRRHVVLFFHQSVGYHQYVQAADPFAAADMVRQLAPGAQIMNAYPVL